MFEINHCCGVTLFLLAVVQGTSKKKKDAKEEKVEGILMWNCILNYYRIVMFSVQRHLLSLIAEPSVSDTFLLEGKSNVPPNGQNVSQRVAGSVMSSDSLCR